MKTINHKEKKISQLILKWDEEASRLLSEKTDELKPKFIANLNVISSNEDEVKYSEACNDMSNCYRILASLLNETIEKKNIDVNSSESEKDSAYFIELAYDFYKSLGTGWEYQGKAAKGETNYYYAKTFFSNAEMYLALLHTAYISD